MWDFFKCYLHVWKGDIICYLQSCQGTTMKMLENSHLPNINPQFHVLPMQLYLRHAEPTFMKAQKCPIYLGIHTYNTFKSAFTVIPTPVAKLIHCCLLQLYTCYAIFVYWKIILYNGGCVIIRIFTLFLLMNSAAAWSSASICITLPLL